MEKKTCFVISPIGEDGSEVRKTSDKVLKYIVKPAVESCGYDAIRADAIDKPGLITSDVIDNIVNSPLVIADLSGRNPNVFYELAVRHTLRLPVIQILKKGENLPFDIAGTRVIYFDISDIESIDEAKNKIILHIKSLQDNLKEIDTPISAAIDLKQLRQSTSPEKHTLAKLISSVEGFKEDIEVLGKNIELTNSVRKENGKLLQDIKKDLQKLYIDNNQQLESKNYRRGRDEFYEFMNHQLAFEHLTELILDYIQKNRPDHIEMRFMAVAMRYSLPFLENIFLDIVKTHKNITFNLKIVVTNYNHISKLKLDPIPCDWANESKNLIDRINGLVTYCNDKDIKNINIDVSVFNEIPQRHGILLKLKEYHLFQGVSDWDMTKVGYPRLTVGSNLYRYYNETKEEGRYWISLFRHWFSFYQRYQDLLITLKNENPTP